MYFVSFKSVNHPASRLFHAFGPVDVILLIKPGAQLDQNRDFFPVLRCRAQIFHKPCLLRQPVDRDLNRHYIRICRCLADKLKEGIHALIGIREKHVFSFYLLHHIPVRKEARRLRRERRINQRALHGFRNLIRYGEDKSQLHRHLRAEYARRSDFKPVAEIFLHLFSKCMGSLKTHNRHSSPLMKSLLHDTAEILVVRKRLVIRRHIGISRHTDIVLV